MKLTIKDNMGKSAGELEVKFPLVEDGKGTQAVHDAVVGYQAAQRMGTASTKTMGEVAGSRAGLSEIPFGLLGSAGEYGIHRCLAGGDDPFVKGEGTQKAQTEARKSTKSPNFFVPFCDLHCAFCGSFPFSGAKQVRPIRRALFC